MASEGFLLETAPLLGSHRLRPESVRLCRCKAAQAPAAASSSAFTAARGAAVMFFELLSNAAFLSHGEN